MGVKLIWNAGAMALRRKKIAEAQDYIDSECLKRMTLYVPVGLPYYKNSGKLRDSGRIAEPGKITYTAPFAKNDYYNRNVNHRHGGNPNATALWFETMKSNHKEAILRGVAAIVGGKTK